MRNYIKYFGQRFTAHDFTINPEVNFFVTAFGRTKKECATNLATNYARLKAFNNPARIWDIRNPIGPIDYYFKLNKDLIYNFLFADPAFWWDNTIPPDQETVVAFQDNVATDKSPRATFPTKQGTDGQRLRSGRTKDEGAALNYIGKLYFLTSKTVFKTIWNLLSSGKISTKEALDRANALL
jgi:hypothetical protein